MLEQVSHPGVCQLLGQGSKPNNAYLLLSNYGQRTLRTCVEQGIAVKVLRDIVLQIAAALEALHAHGFAHGDLRPEHVLIAPNQQAVLIDLHCAYRLDSKPQAADYDGGSLHISVLSAFEESYSASIARRRARVTITVWVSSFFKCSAANCLFR